MFIGVCDLMLWPNRCLAVFRPCDNTLPRQLTILPQKLKQAEVNKKIKKKVPWATHFVGKGHLGCEEALPPPPPAPPPSPPPPPPTPAVPPVPFDARSDSCRKGGLLGGRDYCGIIAGLLRGLLRGYCGVIAGYGLPVLARREHDMK